MPASIPYNPYLTTNAAGFFSAVSDGYVQGVAEDDPSYRNWLTAGVLAAAETLPMWGGIAVYENLLVGNVPLPNDSNPVGNTIGRATNVTVGATGQIAGFSVLNQQYAAVITTSSQVPLVASGGGVNIYRLGSHARIPVAIDPTLIATLGAGSIVQNVSWDYVNQRLTTYAPAYLGTTITGATWATTAGGQATFTVGRDYTALLVAGDYINVSGVVSTGGGTGGQVGYNGSFPVVSTTSTTVVVAMPATSTPGTYSSGGAVAAGGGALPCKILKVQQSNCKVVNYNATTNTANWSNNGSLALIQI